MQLTRKVEQRSDTDTNDAMVTSLILPSTSQRYYDKSTILRRSGANHASSIQKTYPALRDKT